MVWGQPASGEAGRGRRARWDEAGAALGTRATLGARATLATLEQRAWQQAGDGGTIRRAGSAALAHAFRLLGHWRRYGAEAPGRSEASSGRGLAVRWRAP